MKFVHLSHSPLEKFKTPATLGKGIKPLGSLWVACGSEWKDLLERGGFDLPPLQYTVDVDLDKLVVLKTEADIKAFSDQFVASRFTKKRHFEIDWDKVRETTGKSGIYIENAKLDPARFEYAWYGTFSICSAALWRDDAILSITQTGSGRKKTRKNRRGKRRTRSGLHR